jgi:ArsR family transcriptional regulator, arsenate/arsenite/antimonite-responsive transcriptional repressor
VLEKDPVEASDKHNDPECHKDPEVISLPEPCNSGQVRLLILAIVLCGKAEMNFHCRKPVPGLPYSITETAKHLRPSHLPQGKSFPLTYFDISGIIEVMASQNKPEQASRYADMFAAMGAEPRLRIMQILLTAHPDGLVVGEIQSELGIPPSTLSHHLDKLRNEELVRVNRKGSFLWYTANTDSLQELITFLYAECCTRNKAIEPGELVTIGQPPGETRKGKNR